MRFDEICPTTVAEYARRLAWDVGCRSYVVVAQGRRGPQASCRINGTQSKTAASGDSCSRKPDGKESFFLIEEKLLLLQNLRAAARKVSRVRVCSLSLYKETRPNDLKRASRGGRRAVERNDVNPTHRHGNVQGTDGGVPGRYFRCERRPAVEAVSFGWLRSLRVSDGIMDRPGAPLWLARNADG